MLRMLSFIPVIDSTKKRVNTTTKSSVSSGNSHKQTASPNNIETTAFNNNKNDVKIQNDPPIPPQPNEKLSSQNGPISIDWGELLKKLDLTDMTKTFASHCSLKSFNNEKMELILQKNYESLLNENLRQRLNIAINKSFNKDIKLIIISGEITSQTPAQQAENKAIEKHKTAVNDIKKDKNIQEIASVFNIEIDPDLVKINEN